MKCPTCDVDLLMTERHGVEIDYCPKCRGVWLDRGELDKIIEKATGPLVQPEPDREPDPDQRPTAPQHRVPDPQVWQEPYREPPREHHERRDPRDGDRYAARGVRDHDRYRDDDDDRWDDRYRGGKSYKKRRRKSILAEIFDFD